MQNVAISADKAVCTKLCFHKFSAGCDKRF